MKIQMRNAVIGMLFVAGIGGSTVPAYGEEAVSAAYFDEAAYTQYVEETMQRLDSLYLDFCASCGVDAAKAGKARQEFLVTVRDLMQHMNGRFDRLDPKVGDALSPTETLVSVHVLTMLVDILTAMQIEDLAAHPYVN